MTNIPNHNQLACSALIDIMIENGVDQFYPSPGLRNGPLLNILSKTEEAKIFLGIDERSQSFRALGAARASGRPTVLLCTSGSAMAHYAPAVCEAYKSHIPLIILSADRPKELVQTDANQCMDQTHFFDSFCAYTFSMDCPGPDLNPSYWKKVASRLVYEARTNRAPVHLNLPFRDPLDDKPEDMSTELLQSYQDAKGTHYIEGQEESVEFLNRIFSDAKSPLIVVGELTSNEKAPVLNFLKKSSAPKYIDVTSSLKYHFSLKDNSVPTFDHPEVSHWWDNNPPDVIFHIGGRITSKKYYQWLEKNNVEVITLHQGKQWKDPVFSVDTHIQHRPENILRYLAQFPKSIMNTTHWEKFVAKKRQTISEGPLTYPQISMGLLDNLPENIDIMIGNSTIIRSFDSYVHPSQSNDRSIFTQRGLSGIEGFLSGALGKVETDRRPTLLILGDVSFQHDINALIEYSKNKDHPLTIVIVNNNGGGIFSLLPLEGNNKFWNLLKSPHHQNLNSIGDGFGLQYSATESLKELKQLVLNSFEKNEISIIEAQVDDKENVRIYQQLRTIKL